MPSAAHFQVAKTVSDFLRNKTKDEIFPTRREMIAELRPIMTLLGRKESTVQSMIDVLIRLGSIKNEKGFYRHVRGINLPDFATEVDKHNPNVKMKITYVYPEEKPKEVTINIQMPREFTDQEVEYLSGVGISIKPSATIIVGNRVEYYELTGTVEVLREFLTIGHGLDDEQIDEAYPNLA
jgi:hypothetical protein